MGTIIDDDFRGERMSFLQLIENYSIVIPVIQRDYAQGRTDDERVSEIRKNFVRNLISYLRDKEKSSHDLDFIYGTVNTSSEHNDEFIPLDGQQRLTTLFLLHWYLAGRSGHFDDFAQKMQAGNNKYKFAYKTRESSTMFCEKLLSKYDIRTDKGSEPTDIFKQLEIIEKEPKTKSFISETIQNQGWFFQSWLNDPTIAGMLVMLTEIDEQFITISDDYSWTEAYDRLCENENPPITFQLLPLNGYNRTDDLYIKLNARGIHLSDFENFKARIEDLMDMDGIDSSGFKNKIDIEWAEYLWKYRGGGDNTDAIMENLFRNFIALSYRTNESEKADILKERMDYLLEQNKKKLRFTFSRYCELMVMHRRDETIDAERLELEKKMIESVGNMFDVFCNDQTTPENANCKWLRADQYIKNRTIDSNVSYPNRLRLYAYLQYCNLHKESINNDDLCQWMRLVRNLQDATDINGSEDFYKSLRSADNILLNIGSKNVQDWLATDARNYSVNFFLARQMKEECIKAELMAREKEFNLNIISTAVEKGDDDEYLTGQMGFVLEFAGAYEKYENNEISNLPESEIKSIGEKISSYLEKTKAVLVLVKSNNSLCASEKLLERALLSLGMYLRTNSYRRYNFCNTSEQYNTWKSLLYVDDDNRYCREIFKALLDKVSKDNVERDLQDIIQKHSSEAPLWRRLIINNKELIKYCNQGFLYIEDPSRMDEDNVDIILFGQSKMSHYHYELRSLNLYESCKTKYENKIGYWGTKKKGELSVVVIQFSRGDERFTYLLSYWNGEWKNWTKDKNWEDVSERFQYGIKDEDDGETRLKKVFAFLSENGYNVNN